MALNGKWARLPYRQSEPFEPDLGDGAQEERHAELRCGTRDQDLALFADRVQARNRARLEPRREIGPCLCGVRKRTRRRPEARTYVWFKGTRLSSEAFANGLGEHSGPGREQPSRCWYRSSSAAMDRHRGFAGSVFSVDSRLPGTCASYRAPNQRP